MANEIKTKITLEGEKAYKQALAEINRQLRESQSAVRAAAAEYQAADGATRTTAEQTDALNDVLERQREKLALMQAQHIGEIRKDNIVCLGMPLKVQELVNTVNMMVDNMERRRRKRRLPPKVRNDKDTAMIAEAKELLMSRNHMTEEEAHRYIQRSSMDTGTNMVETAQMVLTMMR